MHLADAKVQKIFVNQKFSDEKDLIIGLNAFHIYEGESHITVTDFMATALHNLKKFGLLDYGVADLATPPKAPHQSCYFVQVLV